MKKRVAALLALSLVVVAGSPAHAVQADRVRITPKNATYLQIAELQIFSGGQNIALGRTGTASSVYYDARIGAATDGFVSQNYPDIYHSGNDNGSDFFDLNFGQSYDVSAISIFGRTGDDCCHFRDIYNYAFFNGAGDLSVASGSLDARRGPAYAASAIVASVPEPASWGMMLLGFGMVGFGLRAAKRRSDAKFDAKIKRIAAGLEA